MINLIDNQQCGLIAWGTKRGKQVFFAHNVKGDLSDIDNGLTDVRIPVQVQEPNLSFFGIDHNPTYAIITMYRSIYDWLNRPGYYAISLVFPGNSVFKHADQLMPLLQELTKLYYDKYIAPNPKSNQILDVREDVRFFSEPLKIPDLEIIHEQGDRSGKYQDRCLIQYKDHDQLGALLQYFRREELKNYGQIFLLPSNEGRLHCSYPRIELKPIVHTVKLIISVADHNNKSIPNVKYQIEKYNNFNPQLQCFNAENGIIELDKLVESDAVKISIQKPGYETQNLTALLSNNWRSFFADPKQKIVKLPVIMKPAAPPSPPPPIFPPQVSTSASKSIEIPTGSFSGASVENIPTVDAPRYPPEMPTYGPVPGPKDKVNAKALISIGVIIVMFFLLIALWCNFFNFDKIVYDYETNFNNLKTSYQKTEDSSWNSASFKKINDIISTINKQIASDSVKNLSDNKRKNLRSQQYILNNIKNLFDRNSKRKSEDHISKLIISDKFESDDALKIKDEIKNMNVDTSFRNNLKNYINACDYVNDAKLIIKGEGNKVEGIKNITEQLNRVLKDKNYGFLTDEQKSVVTEYKKILELMNNNTNLKNGKDVLDWMTKNKPGLRAAEIKTFMDQNGLTNEE